MRTELTVFQQMRKKVQSFYSILNLRAFEKKLGRKLAMPIVDYLTFALLKHSCQITTKKKLYQMFELASHCSYKTLVVNINRWARLAAIILTLILKANRTNASHIKHTDSTDIPVCLNKNANKHKTMKGLASWSHSGKGYYYGLKLHLTSDLAKRMLALKITSANVDDREMFIPLNQDMSGLFISDAGYVSRELERKFNEEGKHRALINPRKNMKKLATFVDTMVYNTRMIIELNFRNLKMFFGLITSLPRSVDGYLANYIHGLLAYALV